mgnify:CR=1 FL=1
MDWITVTLTLTTFYSFLNKLYLMTLPFKALDLDYQSDFKYAAVGLSLRSRVPWAYQHLFADKGHPSGCLLSNQHKDVFHSACCCFLLRSESKVSFFSNDSLRQSLRCTFPLNTKWSKTDNWSNYTTNNNKTTSLACSSGLFGVKYQKIIILKIILSKKS